MPLFFNKFFALYQINTFIKDSKIFINLGDIELEISKEEIEAEHMKNRQLLLERDGVKYEEYN